MATLTRRCRFPRRLYLQYALGTRPDVLGLAGRWVDGLDVGGVLVASSRMTEAHSEPPGVQVEDLLGLHALSPVVQVLVGQKLDELRKRDLIYQVIATLRRFELHSMIIDRR
ncbi:hypothetical protein [Streptomyces parvus]|uniref:hypothetical protein n=1 Tax=Streptomyces parvus TaxID=66428 RepID=UPI0033247F62